MTPKKYFEQAATSIAVLDREELQKRIKNFKGRFKLDFSDEYLNKMTVERLRHVLLAALINGRPRN